MGTLAQRSERRRALVQPFLDPGEELLGAFGATRGGTSDAATAVDLIDRLIPGLGIGWLGVFGGSPVSCTIAVTRSGVIVLRNGALGRPKSVEQRFPGEILGPVVGTMECVVKIGDDDYTIPVGCVDEARRLARPAR